MKKIALLLTVAIMAAMFAPMAFAANDYVIADFSSEAAIKAFTNLSTSGISEKEYKDGGLSITTSNADPYITMDIKKANRFEASDYPVVKISYKLVEGTTAKGQLFFATSTPDFKMGDAGTYTEYVVDTTTTDWQDAVVDMDLIAGTLWADTVKTFRVDPAVPAEGETVKMVIRYVGFFKTEKDALAFDFEKYTPAKAPEAATDTSAKTDATTTTTTTAPKTADPGVITAIIAMAVSAGAALSIKKRK